MQTDYIYDPRITRIITNYFYIFMFCSRGGSRTAPTCTFQLIRHNSHHIINPRPKYLIFERGLEPTGRTVRFRGVSVYDVSDGLIQREAMYIDLATLMVELRGED